jgi:hypothetical protein
MGCLSRSEWKLVYCAISFVTKALSFVLAFFLDRSGIPGLLDFCIGSIFLSISVVHILPRAFAQLSGHYPFT